MKNHLQFKMMAVTAMVLFLCLSVTQAFASAPTITGFSPESGPVGSTVTITGTNFNTTAANNVVFFGATRAAVSSADATTLTVTVPVGATCQNISVTDITTGLTAYSSRPFITTFDGSTVFNPNSFADKVDYETLSFPYDVSIADFDNDGKPDLAVVNSSSNNISVFRNASTTGSISFADNIFFVTGRSPQNVSKGDIDGDGKPDLIVTNYIDNTVSVLQNTSSAGTISFAARDDYTTGNNPQSVSVGDIDSDGKPDLVIVNYNSNTVSLFRNTSTNGAVSFATKVDFETGSKPHSVSLGDIDGDGKPDLAVTNYSDNTVSVLKNTSATGTISFDAKVDYATGNNPQSISIGDIDGDGKPDLVVTNYNDNTVSLFKNTSATGTISFDAKVDYATGNNPQSISIGDIDGDGKPDLVVTNYNDNTVSLFKNTSTSGNFSFGAEVNYATGNYPYSLSIGDLDSDGKPELAVVNSGSNTVSVLRSRVMPPPAITSFAPTSATSGETVTITGADLTEIMAVSFGATEAHSFTKVSSTMATAIVGAGVSGDVSVTTPGGTATLAGFTYTLPAAPAISSFTPTSAKPGDTVSIAGTNLIGTTAVSFGGTAVASFIAVSDTKIEAVAGAGATGDVSVTTPGGETTQAGFTFIPPPTINTFTPASGVVGTMVTISGTNFNTTATNNIVFFGATLATVSSATTTMLTVIVPAGATYQNISVTDITTGLTGYSSRPFIITFDGSAVFSQNSFTAIVDYATGNYPYGVSIADLDGDGKPDLVATNEGSNMVSALKNTSIGDSVSFANKEDFTTGYKPNSLSIGDLDGDGRPDLAVLNRGDNTISILKNTSIAGTISFATKVDYVTGKSPFSVSIGDMDGDGKPDLAVANRADNTVSVLKNTSIAGTISFAAKVDYVTGKYPYSVSIGDVDGDGKPDLAVANRSDNTVSVLKNTGTAGIVSFAAKVDYATGTSPYSVLIGDMDGDGKPDMAVANIEANTVSVFKNTSTAGMISFAAKADYATGTYPVNLSMGDMNGDGKPDLAIANYSSNTISVLRNTSTPGIVSFAAKVNYATGNTPYGVSIGDINGDGKPDLAVANVFASTVSVLRSRVMPSPTITSFTPTSAATGDTVTITGTNLSDLVAVSFGNEEAHSYTGVSSTVMKAVVGEGATGNLSVTTPGGTATLAGFNYLLSQAITFDALNEQSYGDPDFSPDATASSSLAVIYTSSDISIASVVSDKVHIKGVGTCIIYADQPGDDTYAAAPQVSQSLTVNAKSVSVTGVTTNNKVYDGTTSATLSGGTLSGIINSDDVTLVNGTGEFADKNAETGKTVTVTGYTITGTDAGNYFLSAQPTGLTADITPAALAITGVSAGNKVYDGTTSATLTGGTLSGIINSDDVTLVNGTGEFADKNAETGKTVTVTGYTITGTDVGNYSLSAQPTGLTADITPAPLTITADPGQSKDEGAADPELTYTITEGSLMDGDALTGSLTREAGETAGTYAIQTGNLSAGDNYTITFISADFTINSASAISDVSVKIPRIYPNPTIGLVNLEVSDGEVTVINAGGKVLIQRAIDKDRTIDLSGYASGMYVLFVKTGGSVYEYKIMKQ